MKNRRISTLLLVLVLAITYMPLLAMPVYAGGGTDLTGIVKGLRSDETVDVGMTLSVSMADLDALYGDFSTVYDGTTVDAGWSITTEEYGEGTYIKGVFADGKFSYTIKDADAGKYIRFETNGDDSTYNNMTNAYKINKKDAPPETPSEELKATFSGTNGDGTIDMGSTISASLSQIFADNPGIQSQYEDGKIEFVFRAGAKADFSDAKNLETSVSAGTVAAKVTLEDSALDIRLWTVEKKAGGTNARSAAVHVESLVNVLKGPEFGTYVHYGNSTYGKYYRYDIMGDMELETNKAKNKFAIKEKIVKLYRNGVLVGEERTSEYNGSVTFDNVDISYDKEDTLMAQIFVKLGGMEVSGPTFTIKDQADQMGKNKTYATRLSDKKVSLKWTGVSGASGYYIYKGSKKIAEVGATKRAYTVSKKGAAKDKYKVVPFVKSGSNVYTSGSNAAKPAKNVAKFSRSTNPKSYSYCTCNFVVTRVELKGKTYVVTGYAVNNRIFKMNKYSKLKLSLNVGGKKAFSKTYKNLKVGVGASKSKKMTLKIKGKAGLDLAHSTVSITVSEKPKWPYPAL